MYRALTRAEAAAAVAVASRVAARAQGAQRAESSSRASIFTSSGDRRGLARQWARRCDA